MQVSAVGGMGAGGGAAGAVGGAAGATAGTAGASAAAAGSAAAGAEAAGSIEGTFLQGTVPAGLEALSEVAENFGDISLLFTLLILALLDKNDEDGGGAAGALGLLVGLSLASQLGQSFGGDQPGQSIAATGGTGGLGGQLDVSA